MRRAGVAVAAVVLLLAVAVFAYSRLLPNVAVADSSDTDSHRAAAVGHAERSGSATPLPAASAPGPSAPAQEAAVSSADLYRVTSAALIRVLEDQGAPAALAELDQRMAADPRVAGVCHAIAHDLGHAALEAAHGRASTALEARDDVCGGGFTHGVIEMVLGASRHPGRDLLSVCAPAQDGACSHGVGHGLMFATGMDVERSLSLCDRAPAPKLATRCGEGVFMQLFSADVSGGHTAHAMTSEQAPATARRTCAATRSPYAASCWFYAPTLWLADRPDDFAGAMGWCRSAPSDLGRLMCARGVGSRTVKYHPDDPTVGARVCAEAGALTDSCLAGMDSYWSVHFRGERPPGDVCGHLDDASLAKRCRAVT